MPMKDSTNLSDRHKGWGEVLRFGLVGGSATVIQYLAYWWLLKIISPTPAMTIAYALSFAYNFYASTHYTFRVDANARRGLGFALSHAINYVLQMGTLHAAIAMGISKQWAPIPMFAICVPINFLLVRYFLKR